MARKSVRHHRVYVVELDGAVLKQRRFRAANPGYQEGLLCLYVGMTGLTPEARFRRHLEGIQSSPYVRRFGLRLLPKLYDRFNPMTFREAALKEHELASWLRSEGFAVWQH